MSIKKAKRIKELLNRALLLVYDTSHPMPKVAISTLLSKAKTELDSEPETDKADKYGHCRAYSAIYDGLLSTPDMLVLGEEQTIIDRQAQRIKELEETD